MHFFKGMMPGFHQKLKLPRSVCKELERERQKSERAILESRLGRWKASMCRNSEDENDDLICLNEGWPEFVDRHALSIGDFVVFEHTGNLQFNVSVFDSSACEKEYDEDKKEATKNTTIAEIIEEAEKQSRCFVKTMVPHYATKGARVSIPKELMRRYGLGRQTSASLRDPRGRVWAPVTLTFQEAIRMRMCGVGWRHFYAPQKRRYLCF